MTYHSNNTGNSTSVSRERAEGKPPHMTPDSEERGAKVPQLTAYTRKTLSLLAVEGAVIRSVTCPKTSYKWQVIING